MAPTDPVDVTLVLECTTAAITGRCDAARNLDAWLAEIDSLAPATAELLLVAPVVPRALDRSHAALRVLEVPGAGYYALKNAGANAARGRIVAFSDLDCRPEPGYLRGARERLADPRVGAVAGRSLYDGDGVWTRINSANSFGDLYSGARAFDSGMALAHNVVVARAVLPRNPWGPFVGRIGGDGYLTNAVRRTRLVVLDERLRIYHEDPTWKLRGLVERHLRDVFVPRRYGTPDQRHSALFTLACALLLRPALRARRVLRGGRGVGLRWYHTPVVALVEVVYWLFDVALAVSVLGIPPVRRRWLAFLAPEPIVTP
jgi:hypothetical protein